VKIFYAIQCSCDVCVCFAVKLLCFLWWALLKGELGDLYKINKVNIQQHVDEG
jgi:hypothetical protein